MPRNERLDAIMEDCDMFDAAHGKVANIKREQGK